MDVYTALLQVIDMVGEAKLAPAHARKRLGSEMTPEAKVLLLLMLITTNNKLQYSYCLDRLCECIRMLKAATSVAI
jgi:hypothetical protein